ncbi:MAG: hypothetical protein IPH18_09810 [Chitinophagaceae bacterium]|nr:hypothetical protein [Chitinophagaceae bacterium]
MVVCQLDVHLFTNDLQKFGEYGLSYIGAPWITETWMFDHIHKIKSYRRVKLWNCLFKRRVISNMRFDVGNGGLSIRNIKNCFWVTLLGRLVIPFKDIHKMNEDVYFSVYAVYLFPFFKSADRKIAASFSIEKNPELAYLLNEKMPMGVHAWEKYGNEFWGKQIFR